MAKPHWASSPMAEAHWASCLMAHCGLCCAQGPEQARQVCIPLCCQRSSHPRVHSLRYLLKLSVRACAHARVAQAFQGPGGQEEACDG